MGIINAAHGNEVICDGAVSEVFALVPLSVVGWEDGFGEDTWGGWRQGALGAWGGSGRAGTGGAGEQGRVPEDGRGVRSRGSLSRPPLT